MTDPENYPSPSPQEICFAALRLRSQLLPLSGQPTPKDLPSINGLIADFLCILMGHNQTNQMMHPATQTFEKLARPSWRTAPRDAKVIYNCLRTRGLGAREAREQTAFILNRVGQRRRGGEMITEVTIKNWLTRQGQGR